MDSFDDRAGAWRAAGVEENARRGAGGLEWLRGRAFHLGGTKKRAWRLARCADAQQASK